MKTSLLTVALLFAFFAFFSQAAFLPFQKPGSPNKFLDECVQWGMKTFSDSWGAKSYENPENIVPTYNVTGLVANFSYEMDEKGTCPIDWNVTLSVFCPWVGEKKILNESKTPISE